MLIEGELVGKECGCDVVVANVGAGNDEIDGEVVGGVTGFKVVTVAGDGVVASIVVGEEEGILIGEFVVNVAKVGDDVGG